mmetsp:Transcript_71207/g.148547  ORF Transcript_71207/g.148547 Transcript_71207/m.148547 type:complete len:215 (-) Transcript_71207:277-921(-)
MQRRTVVQWRGDVRCSGRVSGRAGPDVLWEHAGLQRSDRKLRVHDGRALRHRALLLAGGVREWAVPGHRARVLWRLPTVQGGGRRVRERVLGRWRVRLPVRNGSVLPRRLHYRPAGVRKRGLRALGVRTRDLQDVCERLQRGGDRVRGGPALLHLRQRRGGGGGDALQLPGRRRVGAGERRCALQRRRRQRLRRRCRSRRSQLRSLLRRPDARG